MRKRILTILLITLCVLFSGCVPAVETPADELRQYAWSTETDGGGRTSLTFEDTNAVLTVENPDFTLLISGLCVLTDDRMSICDEASSVNYTFTYVLHGDRVELSYYDGTISLNKDDKR